MGINDQILQGDDIRRVIFRIRGVQVMLDSDLAKLYGVETKNLNLAVKRNLERFPERYRFQLTEEEWEKLKSQMASLRLQNETLNKGRGNIRERYLNYEYN